MNFMYMYSLKGLQGNERDKSQRAFVEMQTCIKVEGTVGVVSMETKSEGEWRILLSLLLPE